MEYERYLRTEVEQFRGAAGAATDWLDAKDSYDREQRGYSTLKGKLEAVRELERETRSLGETAPLTESAEWDWGYVEGRALTYVQGRRDDAPAALREYDHLQSIQSKRNEYELERQRFELLHSASEEALAELSNYPTVHARLEEGLKRAQGELERAGAHTGVRLGPGSEDVAQLSPSQLDELHQVAKPTAPVNLFFAVGGLAIGVLLGFVLGLEIPGSMMFGAVLAALGFFLGGRLTNAKRASRAQAQATLERHATWRARQPSTSPFDPEALGARVRDAQRELDTFLARTISYKQAYGDVEQAVSAYKRAVDGVERCNRRGRRDSPKNLGGERRRGRHARADVPQRALAPPR